MPVIGRGCHELRLGDQGRTWRLVYAVETDAIVILEVFEKKTQKMPRHAIDSCKGRLARFRRAIRDGEN